MSDEIGVTGGIQDSEPPHAIIGNLTIPYEDGSDEDIQRAVRDFVRGIDIVH